MLKTIFIFRIWIPILGGRWQNRELVTINNVLVDGTVFHRMIEWLYTGQVKLMIGQIDDALRLCKQCRLLEFEEEIHAAFTKADSFGIIHFRFRRKTNFPVKSHNFLSFY